MTEKKNTKDVAKGKGTNEICAFTPKMIKGIKDNSFVIFAASRRAGKTVLASYILKHLGKRLSAAFVISKTSTLQGAFEIIDGKFHFNPSDTSFEEIVKTIIKFQEK
jgi:type IV secretory pathway VirB4 component